MVVPIARTNYKGFDLPDGNEIPDVPADLRKVVDGLGEWQSFTPTANNAGQIPVTLSTIYARYTRTVRYVVAECRLIVQTDSASSGQIEIDLPVPCVTTNQVVGTFLYIDSSLGTNTTYIGAALSKAGSPSKVFGMRDNIPGAVAMATSLATNDVLMYSVQYESASAP